MLRHYGETLELGFVLVESGDQRGEESERLRVVANAIS
jgi:hypothetical protein